MYRFTTVRGHLAILSSTSAARGLSRRSSPCELLLSTVTHFEPHPGGEGWSTGAAPSRPPATLDDYSFQNVWFYHSPRPLGASWATLDDYSFQHVWFHHSPRPLGASWASTATTTTTTRPPPGGHVPSELISVTVTHFEHSLVAISPPPAGHRPAPQATLDG